MSFASGFASGFSSGFSDTQNYMRQREQDAFRLLVDKFARNQDALKISQQEDKKVVDQAKVIAAQAGLDTDAIPSIYQMLKSGIYTPAQLADQAMKGQLGFSKQTEAAMMGSLDQSAAKAVGPVAPAEAPMDLMNPPAQPAEPTQAPQEMSQPQSGNILDRFKQTIMGNRNNGQTYIDKAIKRIAETYGVSEDEARKIVQSQGSYTNEEMAGGDATRITFSTNQQGADAAAAEKRMELWTKIDPKYRDALLDIRTQKQMFNSLNEDVVSVVELGAKNPEALTWASNIAQNITKAYQAGKSVIGLFTYDGAKEAEKAFLTASELSKRGDKQGAAAILKKGEAELEGKIAELEGEFSQIESSPTYQNMEHVAEVRTILEMKYSLMAYKLGIMYNQSGRDFSEKEREFMENIFSSADRPDKLSAKMEELMMSEYSRLAEGENEVRQFGQLRDYQIITKQSDEEVYGSRIQYNPGDYDRIVSEYITKTPEVKTTSPINSSAASGETIIDLDEWLNQ